MTLNDVQRAALALYAARAAGEAASVEQMKAVCYVIRNRVRAGWHDGQWLTVIEHAADVEGNAAGAAVRLNPGSRALQRLVADIDDIYYGARYDRDRDRDRDKGQGTRDQAAQRFAPDAGDLEGALGRSCYWCFVNQPCTPWFQEHILGRAEDHLVRAQMGLMMFFE